jgi:hypothetical protein
MPARTPSRTTAVRVGALLAVLLAGCGGTSSSPEAGGSDSPSGSPASATPSYDAAAFPPDGPQPDGPWIQSLSVRFKVPKGFTGDQALGVTTLTDHHLYLVLSDYAGLGASTSFADRLSEAKRQFKGDPKVADLGMMMVEGRTTQVFSITGDKKPFGSQQTYGIEVTDADNEPVYLEWQFFASPGNVSRYQDEIDGILGSMRWTGRVTKPFSERHG